jgi:hypothetical protein
MVKDNEDIRNNAQDLDFLLATHGFHAVPKGSLCYSEA